jgi:DNA-binding transcriptional LysR family regulator
MPFRHRQDRFGATMTRMELRQLRYYVAVAEDENFNRAARRLHVAQPALSRQVGGLEKELGVALLERLPRGVRLTPAGGAFLERARRILADVEAARAHALDAERGRVGLLRLGFNAIAVKNPVVPEALRRFRAQRPEVELSLNTMTSPEQIEKLYGEALDVGFLYTPPAAHPELQFFEIAPYRMMIALPKRHPLAARPRLRVTDLRSEDFVWSTRQRLPWVHDQLIAECLSKGFSPRIVQEADDAEALLSLVSVGLGVGFIHPAQRSVPGDVVYKELTDLSLVWPLYMAWRRTGTAPVTSAFVELVMQLAKSTRKRGRRDR